MCRRTKKIRRKNSYSSRNPYDIDMMLEKNTKGLKKRRSRIRRGLM